MYVKSEHENYNNNLKSSDDEITKDEEYVIDLNMLEKYFPDKPITKFYKWLL